MSVVSLVTHGETTHAGRLLAPAGVSDIVVLTASVPPLAGLQSAVALPPPAALIAGLDQQSDLSLVSRSSGVLIYANTAFHGIVSQREAGLPSSATSSDAAANSDWVPVLDGVTWSGDVAPGHVLAGLAPAGAFALEVDGHAVKRTVRLGWAAQYRSSGGKATIVLHQFPFNGLVALFTVLVWVFYLAGFGVLERWSSIARRRQRRPHAPTSGVAS
jgi:hypothetical protein